MIGYDKVFRKQMEGKEVKICIIGTGRAGMLHARNFSKNVPGATLEAIVDPAEEALVTASEKLGVSNKFHDYKDALNNCDFDAGVVVTPTKYHKEIVVDMANAGKHIFCEKPMALNIQDCDEMIETVEKNGVRLQIGFMRRFDKAFVAAKKRLEQGEIGDRLHRG